MSGAPSLTTGSGQYHFGAIPGLTGSYNSSSIDASLTKLANAGANQVYAVYNYLLGGNASPAAVSTMLGTIYSAWSKSHVQVLTDSYPVGSGAVYDPSTGTKKTKTTPTTNPPTFNIDLSGIGGAAGVSNMSAAAQASAFNTVDQTLTQWGLQGMADWAWQQITAQGDNVNATGVIDELRGTPQYAAVFPGNVQRMQAGQPPIAELTYKSLEDAYQGYGQQYGLPAGFLSKTVMGNLIANNVSASEFQQRAVNAYQIAMKAPQETRDLLNQYYGINTGDLAAYYFSPQQSLTSSIQQTQAAVLGTEAVATGFGNLSKTQAESLQQMGMLDSAGNINAAQTTAAFEKGAALKPLETAMAGQRGQATVTQNQLLSYAFPGQQQLAGTTAAGDQAALKLAEQARAAGLSGGGGYTMGQKGATGVGSASTTGANTPGP
jgi:hypothetical protein